MFFNGNRDLHLSRSRQLSCKVLSQYRDLSHMLFLLMFVISAGDQITIRLNLFLGCESCFKATSNDLLIFGL